MKKSAGKPHAHDRQEQHIRLKAIACDKTQLIKRTKPSEIYNLAAQSFVPTSWNQPVLTGEFTGLGVTRMLEAIRQVDKSIRFYQASSSGMFGKVRETPQSETTPFHPRWRPVSTAPNLVSTHFVAGATFHAGTMDSRTSRGLKL